MVGRGLAQTNWTRAKSSLVWWEKLDRPDSRDC